MNTIVNLKTLSLQSTEGPVSAIVMGLNITDPELVDSFVTEVAEKFKLQRMCSPPNTSVALITIISEMSLTHFVTKWKQLAAKDQILGFFMSQMKKADVVRGTKAGETLESDSLIEAA